MYKDYINDLIKMKSSRISRSRFAAMQLLELYEEAHKRKNLHIVELGVDKGFSTKVFLSAINDKSDSKLTSIDINDCSNVCNSSKWNFIQSNSIDIDKVLDNSPDIVKRGIDILYIDSLHNIDHVRKELFLYNKYLNKNSTVFFDDVDSQPYMINQRKDSIGIEIGNRKIYEFVESVFLSNLDSVNFSFFRGGTGLARLDKLSEKGDMLRKPKKLIKRTNKIIWKLIYFLLRKKEYSPSSENFLFEHFSKYQKL